MKKASLYKKLDNNLVRCTACNWYCRIAPGQVGVCATRYNQNSELYSLVYGKTTGLAIDPVEKKPLFHFLPSSRLLSFGTVGCNFGCLFCQNYDISQVNKFQIPNSNNQTNPKFQFSKRLENISNLINQISTTINPKEIVEMAVKEGVAGIAYTYNEPAIFVEFAYDTAKLAKKKGLKNIFVSNGFESEETFNLIKDYLDGIDIDLKSFNPDFYQKICKAKIEPVKENIKKYFQAGIETEVTTLIIPGHNDSDKELTEIAQFLFKISPDIPWHVSGFSPTYKMLDTPPTAHETLIRAYNIGKKAGLRYIYLGNVFDRERSSTRCPKCNTVLVSRDGYFIEIKNLVKGKCKGCGEKIYGVWVDND